MDLHAKPSHIRRANPGAPGLFLLAYLLLLSASSTVKPGPPGLPVPAMTQPVATAVLADGWSLSRAWGWVENALSNRRRMIQMATVGLCLGLYILMRNKH